jgi:hypothetical protein
MFPLKQVSFSVAGGKIQGHSYLHLFSPFGIWGSPSKGKDLYRRP